MNTEGQRGVRPSDAQIHCLRRIIAGEKLYFTILPISCPKCNHTLSIETSAWWEDSATKACRSDMVYRLFQSDFIDIDGEGICFATPLGEQWAARHTLEERRKLGRQKL